MRNVGSLDTLDALAKIQALAAAAGYLSANDKENSLCFELLDIIEMTARRCVEADDE